jgi:hypothetical protein
VRDDRRALRAFRPDVLAIGSLVTVAATLVAIYRFDARPFPWVAIVVMVIGANFLATLWRFRVERGQIVAAVGSLVPETAVVGSAMSSFPFFLYPQFFLQRTPAGLSFHRVGSHDEAGLIPWSEIDSIEASGAAKTNVKIAFHDGAPLRLTMLPAGPVSDSSAEVAAWLRGDGNFPEAFAAARYLVSRKTEEGRR